MGNNNNIVLLWFRWHFYQMPKFLFFVWKNYLSFILDYFSITLLLATLFAPWKKYTYTYPKGFLIRQRINVFVFNMISRILGAIVRLFLILLGIIAQIFMCIVGVCGIFLWFLMPLVLPVLILLFLII